MRGEIKMKDVTDKVKPYFPKSWHVQAWTDFTTFDGGVYKGTLMRIFDSNITARLEVLIEHYPEDSQFESLIKHCVRVAKTKMKQWKKEHPQS